MRIVVCMDTTTTRTDMFKVIGFSGEVICKWDATEADAIRWFTAGRSKGGQFLVDGHGLTIAEADGAYVSGR